MGFLSKWWSHYSVLLGLRAKRSVSSFLPYKSFIALYVFLIIGAFLSSPRSYGLLSK